MQRYQKLLPWIYVILFTVGILGFNLEATHDLFLKMVPGFLALVLILLLIAHDDWSRKFSLWAIAVFLFGIGIEWLGVYSGVIFGNYHYGPTLGWKVDGIPVIIGVNWLILSYITLDIVRRFFQNKNLFIRSAIAAGLMTFMDIAIEPVAIQLEFWYWPNNTVPLLNYIGWFVVSLFLFLVSHGVKLSWRNNASLPLYLAMYIFFNAIILFNK